MLHPLCLFLLACAAVAPAAAAENGRGDFMLPPEIARQFSAHYLAGFGEPALWPPAARQGYRTRYRLTISGILYTSVSIRIDQYPGGRLEGHVVYVDPRDRSIPFGRTTWRFAVPRARFEALQGQFREAGLWTIYPQFYSLTDPNAICLDGMELIFERAEADGYRFSNANAQCTASPAMLQAAATMIDLSDAPARGWLR
jgi:hypothetical protein